MTRSPLSKFTRTCVWYLEVLAVLVAFGLLNTLIEGRP